MNDEVTTCGDCGKVGDEHHCPASDGVKVTFADSCLERASKAQVIAVQKHFNLETGCDAYIELQKLDQEMRDVIVTELAKRLKRATEAMKDPRVAGFGLELLADELERPL